MIQTNVITSDNLGHAAKVVYGLLRSKIEGFEYIQTTAKKVAVCLKVSEATIKRAFLELKKAGLVTKSKKAVKAYEVKKVITSGGKGNGFGWVETAILESDKISLESKLFYLFYAAICDKNDISKQPRVSVLKYLAVGNDAYIGFIDALERNGLIQVQEGQSKLDGDEYKYTTKIIKLVRLPFISKKVLSEVVPIAQLKFKSLSAVDHDDRIMGDQKKVLAQNKKGSCQNVKVSLQNKNVSSQDTLLNNININNNKQENVIVISNEVTETFNTTWECDYYQENRGSKESSLKSFSKLMPAEYDEFRDKLADNPKGYYGFMVNKIIAEREAKAKAIAESKKYQEERKREEEAKLATMTPKQRARYEAKKNCKLRKKL